MLNLKRFTEKAATVSSLVTDAVNALPDNEGVEDLERNYGELYSMILDISETLDSVLSDVER